MKWYVLGSLLLAGMMMVCLVCCQTQAERSPGYGLETMQVCTDRKYSLQGTTQGRYLTGGVPPVRFSM